MTDLASRIKRARKLAGLTQKDLAEAVGISQPVISQLEKGTNLQTVHLVAIARACRVSVDWLATGAGDSALLPLSEPAEEIEDESSEMIPVTTARAAAGAGYLNTHIEYREQWPFKRAWLKANSLKAESLVMITADGDSMQPFIFDQDRILVDLSRKEPEDNQIFVMNSPADGVIVKRLIGTGFGWIVRSDNPDKDAFPDRFPRRDEGADLQIVGRVVWRGGEL